LNEWSTYSLAAARETLGKTKAKARGSFIVTYLSQFAVIRSSGMVGP
jgi:hypothetical protein